MRDGGLRIAGTGIGEQSPLQILAQCRVTLAVDLPAVAFPLQVNETLAVQRDVRVVLCIAPGGAAAHQPGHDQQQRGQDHERGEDPEKEHREPLRMADPRPARFMDRNLSAASCAGKDTARVHL